MSFFPLQVKRIAGHHIEALCAMQLFKISSTTKPIDAATLVANATSSARNPEVERGRTEKHDIMSPFVLIATTGPMFH